jgi:hypothetical protein
VSTSRLVSSPRSGRLSVYRISGQRCVRARKPRSILNRCSVRMLLVLAGCVALVDCQKTEDSIDLAANAADCDSLCSRYQKCFDPHYDVAG